ncbi:MAG: MIP family channel protein [Clostridia bacterium]|nr:MIP family channel protein [Clostridia bacterium]
MRKYLSEFIGTFVLVLFGCGTAVFANNTQLASPIGTLGIAFAFGLAIVAMAYSIGNISGCHVNPAVSLAMYLTEKLSFKDFIGYIIAQFAGGIVGAAVLPLIKGFSDLSISGLGQNGYGELSALGIDMWGAIVVEVILTFVFVLVILGVTSKEKYSSVAGLVIGLSLTLIHILGISLTGTSVNPARSFGPALIGMNNNPEAFSQVWVFILAPLVGAVLAALVWKLLSCEKAEEAQPETETEAN